MLNRRTLALAALGLWCLLFVRTRTTEKSMVRAVMLEWDAQGWTAGLLYQAPEAAADSSEASAQVRFAAAQGGSLGQALSTAEGLAAAAGRFTGCVIMCCWHQDAPRGGCVSMSSWCWSAGAAV